MTVRERMEQEEYDVLSPQAQKAAETKGRPSPEEDNDVRTCYQRDADRILHSKTNQCGVYTAMISAAVGEIALVEVENAADVQAVKDIFQARVNYQVGDDENPGGAWYPQTIEGWKNGSRIVSNGNYIMLIALSEGADDVVNSFNALFA